MSQTFAPKLTEFSTDHRTTGELTRLYFDAGRQNNKWPKLDLSQLNHVDANLAALLLALAHKMQQKNGQRLFVDFGDKSSVFFRNGLIAHLQGKFSESTLSDERQSTIPLFTFHADEHEAYYEYIMQLFLNQRGMYRVTKTVKEALSMHYCEVFENVGLHANTTNPVYCCGQYFPNKKQLRFTLVDLGIGFLPKIKEATQGKIDTDTSAIVWATHNMNSTKDLAFGPGGTGLYQLKKYCDENNGSLHICSGKGYVNFIQNRTLEHNLTHGLPGSMINIILRNL